MEIAKKTTIVCTVVLAFMVSLYFVYLSRMIVLYLVVALIFALAINPLVLRLKKLKIGRVTASIVALSILLVMLSGIIFVVFRPLVEQGVSLAQNLPEIGRSLFTNPTLLALSEKYNLVDNFDQLASQISKTLMGGNMTVVFIATNIISVISTISILLVLTFLLLIQGDGIWLSFVDVLSDKNKQVAERVGGRIMKAISGFITGNLLTSLLAGTVALILLTVLKVPYAIPLAGLVTLCDLIPLIGTAIAAIVIGLVALTSSGFVVMLIAVGVLLLYQFLEGHIIGPAVYARSVSLSALFIVVASVVGAEISGIIGILLAIPMAAVVQILATEIFAFFSAVKI